jgi:hypothetical protein
MSLPTKKSTIAQEIEGNFSRPHSLRSNLPFRIVRLYGTQTTVGELQNNC